MKNVQLIRQHVAGYMMRLRSFVSMTDGNVEVVDRLRGKEGDERLARIVAFILGELGHDEGEFNHRGEAASPDAPASNSRRAIAKVRGAKGERRKVKDPATETEPSV